jgi:hypothetical protein
MTHAGHCLCGAVHYEVTAELRFVVNCHCRFCRRANGAAFVTTTPVPTDALRVRSGADRINRHEGRFFCGDCATRLFNRGNDHPGVTALMVATLDPEPGPLPFIHVNVESKANWFEILDDRPQYPGFPEVESDVVESETDQRLES